jgi:hypothetical protein
MCGRESEPRTGLCHADVTLSAARQMESSRAGGDPGTGNPTDGTGVGGVVNFSAIEAPSSGQHLGYRTQGEPITVNVRVVDVPLRGCWSCFTTVVAVMVLVAFALWIFSC